MQQSSSYKWSSQSFVFITAFFICSLSVYADVPRLRGYLEYVICSPEYAYAKAIPVQRFDGPTVQMKWEQGPVFLTEVKLKESGDQPSLWVPQDLLVLGSQCPEADWMPSAVDTAALQPAYVFPALQRTTASYKTGQRAFGARRGGGTRSHAACDLYRVKDEAVVSVGAGKIIRDRYFFYEGTYAIEMKLADKRVVRYGEVTGRKAANVSLNKSVKKGQIIGYIGKVSSNCCEPMLHFELYKGNLSGSLTQSGNKFSRRADLIDPSKFLTDLEKDKFGTSY